MKKTQPVTLPENVHILVIKMAGIGDLLLATPALHALRETYPHAHIDLLVTPDSAGILNGWQIIDKHGNCSTNMKRLKTSGIPSSLCILAVVATVQPGAGRQSVSRSWQIPSIPAWEDSCSC